MCAFKMLWIFLNIFHFTVIFCVEFENQQEIKENFTTLEVEEASGENLEFDQALFNTYVENFEKTDDDFLNVTDYSDRLNENEQMDILNINDSSSDSADEWNTTEPFFGTTENYQFVPKSSSFNLTNSDIINRWLQEEEEEMKSLDFEDYDSEKLNDSDDGRLETLTAETTDEYKTINFENNGQILNLTVVTVSEENKTIEKNSKSYISRQHFGIIRNNDGLKCLSFNCTFDVFFKGERLSLLPAAYVEGSCDLSNSFIKFAWLKADNNRFNTTTNFKIACDERNCFVNSIEVEVEDLEKGEHFRAEKENLQLFESKPGDVYKNATLVRLEMNQNLRISLSNVTFYLAENSNSNELTLVQGAKFGDYYVQAIASVVGFIVLISFTIYIIYILRKIKKSKGDFIPTST